MNTSILTSTIPPSTVSNVSPHFSIIVRTRIATDCFSCCPQSSTAKFQNNSYAKRIQHRLDYQEEEITGGIYSNKCCNNFFLCCYCCKQFYSKISTIAIKWSNYNLNPNFVTAIIDYVNHFQGQYVKLIDAITCNKCSLISLQANLTINLNEPHDTTNHCIIDMSHSYNNNDNNNNNSDNNNNNNNHNKNILSSLNNDIYKNISETYFSSENNNGNNSNIGNNNITTQIRATNNNNLTQHVETTDHNFTNIPTSSKKVTQPHETLSKRRKKQKQRLVLKNKRTDRRKKQKINTTIKQHQLQRTINICGNTLPKSLDGCMIVYPYHIIIPSWLGLEYTHALGTQQLSGEKGPYHCVISLEVAQTIDMEVFWNHTKNTIISNREIIHHTIPTPDSTSIVEERSVEWITFERTEEEKSDIKYSDVSLEYVYGCLFVTTTCDILTFICKPKLMTSDLHLGMQLFFKSHQKVTNNVICDDLLDGNNNLLLQTNKKGIEVTRSGGALGRCNPSDITFQKFMKRQGVFPRIKSACLIIVVNSTTKCGFYCIYISPYKQNNSVIYWYNTPKPGGHLMLKDHHLKTFPLLSRFPWCHVKSAILCYQYNVLHPDKKVISVATNKMLQEWIKAKQKATNYIATCQGTKEELYSNPLYHLSLISKHTLVLHPVSFHRDVFANNGTNCIENKILLLSNRRSDWSQTSALGRGGLGPGAYVFALLDWDANVKGRRTRYLELGGPAEVRVNQTIMDNFLSQIGAGATIH